MLDQITPVLLTFNEEANIARTLSHLTWAKEVVIVDSGSTDRTLAILASFSNVRVFGREFDTHANQWRYACRETGIGTPWILRLDADYQLPNDLIEELRSLDPDTHLSAYQVAFDYAIFSKLLLASLYPPNTVLLRIDRFEVSDDGHTERWVVNGEIGTLNARIVHDDWKTTESWISAQGRYMKRELERIAARRDGFRDLLRLFPPLMPFLAFWYCFLGKGLILNGRAGLFYSLQRMLAEGTLSLMVLEARLRSRIDPPIENR